MAQGNGQHGGDRTPRRPAAVSGPGALSGRTDGQAQRIAAGGGYGDRQDMQQIQSGAAMAEAAPTPVASAPPPVPLNAPTQRPDEPVTAGAALGPGASPEAVGILGDEQGTIEQLRPLLRSLESIANLPSSNPQFRNFVRKLRAQAGS